MSNHSHIDSFQLKIHKKPRVGNYLTTFWHLKLLIFCTFLALTTEIFVPLKQQCL